MEATQTPVSITKEQYVLLNQLGTASDDLMLTLNRIQGAATDDIAHILKGLMIRGISHQTTAEYFEAKGKVEALAQVCGRTLGAEFQHVVTAVYTQGSKAVWDRTLVTLADPKPLGL